jgi:anti-sigma B factor antagonist
MNIDFTLSHGVTVARLLDSRLDAAGAADFKARVGGRHEAGPPLLVLDLAAVEFVDSTGLSAILSTFRRLPADGGGALALAGCRKPVVELIKLTRLDRVLKLFDSTDQAVEALAPG